MEPQAGDSLYIGDDDEGNPIFVVMEQELSPIFMGYIDDNEVWA